MSQNQNEKPERECMGCHIRIGQPFLCPDCQWHMMDALSHANRRIKSLLEC